MYVPTPNTLGTDGVLSPALAPEDKLQHYAKRAGSTKKEKILRWLDASFAGRSRAISVLTEPIPDTANQLLLDFRDRCDLVILPCFNSLKSHKLIDAVYYVNDKEIYKRSTIGDQPIKWPTKVNPRSPYTFKGVIHYMLVLTIGKIPVGYCTIIPNNYEEKR